MKKFKTIDIWISIIVNYGFRHCNYHQPGLYIFIRIFCCWWLAGDQYAGACL